MKHRITFTVLGRNGHELEDKAEEIIRGYFGKLVQFTCSASLLRIYGGSELWQGEIEAEIDDFGRA